MSVRLRLPAAAVLVAAFAAFAAPAPASACSLLAPTPFEPTLPAEADTVPPTLDGPVATEVVRGAFLGGTSCSDLGFLTLTFPPAVDDQAPADDDPARTDEWPGVGYRLTLADGNLPDGLTLGETPIHARKDGEEAALDLVWIDGTEAAQDPLGFTLTLHAVDAAGNLSEPVDIEVADAGGCSTGGGRAGGLGLVLVAGLAGMGRRRHRRPT